MFSFLALALLYGLACFCVVEGKAPHQLPRNPNFTPVPNVDCSSPPQSGYPFCKPGDPMERAKDLVSRLTLDELIAQTSTIAPAIPRLGLKAYNWRSNCLHGWSKSGGHWPDDLKWTVFPAPIGLGATFDPDLIMRVGAATATEGRALHNEMLVKFNGSSTEAAGLNCFSPNVNLFRDPRWGRGQETFGEDPYLISVLGTAYTRGLQGPRAPYTVAACAKHYAVHNGPEELRMKFAANVTLHDLYDTYLPAFKSQVLAGNVAQIMPAYSGLNCSKQNNSAPDSASSFLLQTILREEFSASNISVCSDNGGVAGVDGGHHYVDSLEKAAAVCMNATTDLDLGYDRVYPNNLKKAMTDGLVDEDTIRQSVIRSFYLRMKVGDFDVIDYQRIDKSSLDTEENRKLNLEAARKSIVLLKNFKNSLPLKKDAVKHIAVIGPNANESQVLLSNYEGIPSSVVTVLEGIQSYLGSSVVVDYAPGCDNVVCDKKSSFQAAVSLAKPADYVVMVMGLNSAVEGEGHDRKQTMCEGKEVPLLGLPGCQLDLVEAIAEVNPRVVVVLINGGPLSIQDLLDNQKVLGILEAFYPGAVGGTAVADVLFGNFNPSGKMPVTTPHSASDLPPAESYDMSQEPGRTYRYSTQAPLVPFGTGLSYLDVVYSDLSLCNKVAPCQSCGLSVNVKTASTNQPGEEVVLLYLFPRPDMPHAFFPKVQLVGFKRVYLDERANRVEFEVNPYLMSLVDSDGVHYIYPGTYTVKIGPLSGYFTVTGDQPVKTESCGSLTPQCLSCTRPFRDIEEL